jgi:hypothetical protein
MLSLRASGPAFYADFPRFSNVSSWSAFPVQSHIQWHIVPGEFDKLPAALLVGGKASRPAE